MSAIPANPTHALEHDPDLRFAGMMVHFVGIGGCGMSGLARLLHQCGAICSGSDSASSELTDMLSREGIPISYEQSAAEFPGRCDLVIASAAIKPDHPELLAAQERGINVITYSEALGMIQEDHTSVSLAGTHGKSTTSAMLCHILVEAGLDPGFIIGATCPQLGGGSRTGAIHIPGNGPMAGRPGILVCEACEFNRSFHNHRPTIALINNIEEDHLDVYGSLDAIIEAFASFAKQVPPESDGGRLLIAHEGAHRRHVASGLSCAVETFGYHPEADYQVLYDATARQVTLLQNGLRLSQWNAALPGAHNALNYSAAAILAHNFGASWEEIASALTSFQGLDRRMQRLGSRVVDGGEVVIYDDYGHHPTEIEMTLKALRDAESPDRLICVFQPHQHSRTRFLLEQFAQSFSCADEVIVPQIYFVRDSEQEKHRVNAQDLVDRLRERGVSAKHIYPFAAIVEHLESICRAGDLVVIMGAGPVWQVARQFHQAGVRC